MSNCNICNAPTEQVCEECKRPFCDSDSGMASGVKEAKNYCKKCTQRLYTVKCTKCGNRFQSKEDLEVHFQKHPVHRTEFD